MSDAPANVAAEPRSQGFTRRIVDKTLGRWGARIGLAWIGVVGVFAVFGPLLANSHPIAMKTAEGWSSPMWVHLTAVDLILLINTLSAGLLLVFKGWSRRARWGVFAAGLVVSIVWCLWTVHPPEPVDYEKYRKMEAAGQVEAIVRTIVPYSPTDRLGDREGERFVAPSSLHWLGTEVNGADVLSRMIHASRIAMAIGFIATSIALLIGVVLGALMGYFSKAVDLIGMRLVEIFEMIPQLFLLLMCVAFIGRNLYIMMVIIGLTGWTGYARFTRAEFLKLREQDFVQAAVACGIPLRSILFKHMLPNGMAPVLVSASFGIASAILYEATLSFLGLGLVDEPSWGQMLSQATSSAGTFSWWMAIYPGLAIFLTVFAYNLIGEAVRDAIDPHMKKDAHL